MTIAAAGNAYLAKADIDIAALLSCKRQGKLTIPYQGVI
jgi:hypothetical protein